MPARLLRSRLDVAHVRLSVSPQGDFFVIDAFQVRILRFRRSGLGVIGFGRAGGGPGELEAPSGMAFLGDSAVAVAVAVADLRTNRISRFNPHTGAFLGSRSFARPHARHTDLPRATARPLSVPSHEHLPRACGPDPCRRLGTRRVQRTGAARTARAQRGHSRRSHDPSAPPARGTGGPGGAPPECELDQRGYCGLFAPHGFASHAFRRSARAAGRGVTAASGISRRFARRSGAGRDRRPADGVVRAQLPTEFRRLRLAVNRTSGSLQSLLSVTYVRPLSTIAIYSASAVIPWRVCSSHRRVHWAACTRS